VDRTFRNDLLLMLAAFLVVLLYTLPWLQF
jgi:hypothetical protein